MRRARGNADLGVIAGGGLEPQNSVAMARFPPRAVEAVAVIGASDDGGDPAEWDIEPTVDQCQAAADRSLLFSRLENISEYYRISEWFALCDYLEKRGVKRDERDAVIEAFYGSHADENET